ncbi:hypothetical protein BA950_03655 [Erythrobacter sp. SAORIC-644]|jgi:hypothetical protein|nr:hypothetical protein BA950_03655 [Erythrobacter sp. SAORIC-644]|tara:strand:+ start:574 stop:780 length:207 start_codon:yes stop_codon:yes gene_type:complete
MHQYCLVTRDAGGKQVAEIEFECLSIAGALDKAKTRLRGSKAELYEDGRPVCSMELVAHTGAWLIGSP